MDIVAYKENYLYIYVILCPRLDKPDIFADEIPKFCISPRNRSCCGLLWKVVRRTRNPDWKISLDLVLEVFWFQFFPHHRPGTWIVFKCERNTKWKIMVARKSLTWNLQEPHLKNLLGSRLNFKSPFKVADRFVMTCSNSMLAVSGCSLGSVWACIGFHVSFGVILFKKLVAWFPGEQNPLETVP